MRQTPLVLPLPRVIFTRGRGLGFTALVPPVSGRVSSTFGEREQPTAGASTNHKGIDYAVPTGTAVAAAAGGEVTFAGVQSGYGNVVTINHGSGFLTKYAHLSRIDVKAGDQVFPGELLGLSGATGTVTGPNLHFELTVNGVPADPAGYMGGVALPAVNSAVNSIPQSGDTVDLFGTQVDTTTVAIAAGFAGLALWAVLS